MNKLRVGILGATGTVGQRFIQLLENHPWFEVTCVAASPRSAGKPYEEAVQNRWSQSTAIPQSVRSLNVLNVETDIKQIADEIDFVFSALSLDKAKIREIENQYGGMNVPVVSNNSAHRWTEDVPMIMPEINPHHLEWIDIQRKNRGWEKGLIVVKPNCSIQSYVPVIEAWKNFGPKQVIVSTYQAISGAGKTFDSWPEMIDNVIPYIGGEEKKSEDEPMKIWGSIKNGKLEPAAKPAISATCIRVPVTDGHMVSANIAFEKKPSRQDLIDAINHFKNPIEKLKLPSSIDPFLKYFEEEDRPQTAIDRDLARGMGVAVGRLREDSILDWKFVALSHNTIRGAAGGAVLTAELLVKKGYIG